MKIDEAGVIFPGSKEFARFRVIGARAQAEMLLQIVPAADVIAGENIEATHATEERVFSGPATDAANRGQACESGGIVVVAEGFQIEAAGGDGKAEFEDGALFARAVTECAKGTGAKIRQILRVRTGAGGGVRRRRAAEILHQPIEEHDSNVQRDLLARDGVEQSLEDSRIPGRFEAGKRDNERAQRFLFRREGVKIAKMNPEAEHVLQRGAQSRFEFAGRVRRISRDAQLGPGG